MSLFMWLLLIFTFLYFATGLINRILNIYKTIKELDKDEEECTCKCKTKLEE